MRYENTTFKHLIICSPTRLEDARGYFYETFNAAHFKEHTGLEATFVQDNQSMSVYGVIRGLHLQGGKFAQAKLVRCVQGEILDVVVDMRKEEPTFGKHFSIHLSAENHKQLYIPRGFAHGFSVLSERAVFLYKCDNFYHKPSEVGVAYDDPSFTIDWKVPLKDCIVSTKDGQNQGFKEAVNQLEALES